MASPRWVYWLLLAIGFFQPFLSTPAWGDTETVSTADGQGSARAWAWAPPVGGDNFEAARLALQQAKSVRQERGDAQGDF
jgi:hypothetical protein